MRHERRKDAPGVLGQNTREGTFGQTESPGIYAAVDKRFVRSEKMQVIRNAPGGLGRRGRALSIGHGPAVAKDHVGAKENPIVIVHEEPPHPVPVLGHEVGHILSGHVLYRTLLIIILNLVVFRYTIVGLAIRPILMGLMEWYRKSELSSDRAGLLSVQNPEVTMSALMHMAGGTRGEKLNLGEFVAQSDEYREGGDLLDSVYKVLNILGQTHPFAVIRVGELRDWMETGTYDKILAGEYQRRDEKDGNRRVSAALEKNYLFTSGQSCGLDLRLSERQRCRVSGERREADDAARENQDRGKEWRSLQESADPCDALAEHGPAESPEQGRNE